MTNRDLVANDATKRHWRAIASSGVLPPPIKAYATRRLNIILAHETEQSNREKDADVNRRTRIPEGEHINVPLICLTELYTPTTVAGLLDGLRSLLLKEEKSYKSSGRRMPQTG